MPQELLSSDELNGLILFPRMLEEFSSSDNSGVLRGLSKINLFVGPNNSGKSRFLRELFAGIQPYSYFFKLHQELSNSFLDQLNLITDKIDLVERTGTVVSESTHITALKSSFDISRNGTYLVELSEIFDKTIDTIKRITRSNHRIREFIQEVDSYKNLLSSSRMNFIINSIEISMLYFPILRGLRPLSYTNTDEKKTYLSDNLYKERTLFDYFPKLGKNRTIFTGISIFEEIKKRLLGTVEERKSIYDFEKYLEQYVFKKRVTLIPKYDDDVLHIKLGQDEQFAIYKLGDGLQTIIIILFPLFINKSEIEIVFIEEPETHLHPKWQRQLMYCLSEMENKYFFISSHSSILINAENTSIFSITKNSGKTEITSYEQNEEKFYLLKRLGYRPSDLFLTNYVLWVEGPTDMIYFRYLIEFFSNKTLHEGVHYTIMSLGGDDWRTLLVDENGDVNLGALTNLSPNNGIVLDSDKSSADATVDATKQKVISSFESSGLFSFLLEYNEIENYVLLDDYIKAIKLLLSTDEFSFDKGEYGDRIKIESNVGEFNYPKILLDQKVIQSFKENNGSVKMAAAELKKSISNSIKKARHRKRRIKKMNIAKTLVKMEFTPIDSIELEENMSKLIDLIEAANT